MALLKTPADLGNVIRQRRKALGWDQADLARESAVSRQWVVDMEKGKPRAELQLVLRVMNVLGLTLSATSPGMQASKEVGLPPMPDIDDVVNAHGHTHRPAHGQRTAGRNVPSKVHGAVNYTDILQAILLPGLTGTTSATAPGGRAAPSVSEPERPYGTPGKKK